MNYLRSVYFFNCAKALIRVRGEEGKRGRVKCVVLDLLHSAGWVPVLAKLELLSYRGDVSALQLYTALQGYEVLEVLPNNFGVAIRRSLQLIWIYGSIVYQKVVLRDGALEVLKGLVPPFDCVGKLLIHWYET